jgi:hypothetical protein
MKKLAPTKQAEALKFLFNNPDAVIAEREKPRKSKKAKSLKMAWYVGSTDIDLSDKAMDKMEEKKWIKAVGDGKFGLDEEGHALGEMISGQKAFDFDTNIWMKVTSYDEDPLLKPDILGVDDDDEATSE